MICVVRIELDAEASRRPRGDRLPELREALRERVAHSLPQPGDERLADEWIRRLPGIAGPEVDHLDPALLDPPRRLVQAHERVRRLALEDGRDRHGQTLPVTKFQSARNVRSSASISTCSSRRCA